MTSIKKQIHYRFNRLLYRFRFCKYRDECMLDIMLVIKGHKYIE